MYIEFDKEYLQELYEYGKCGDKKHRFQPIVVKKYVNCVRILLRSRTIESLYQIKSLNYEVLTGDKRGISSIRIDLKYRLEFLVRNEGDEEIITICQLLDISNHYKKLF